MRISDWSSDVCSSDLSYHFCFFRPGFAAMSFAAKRSGRALLLILVCLFAWPVCMTAAVAAAPPAQTKEDVQPDAGTGLGKHQLVRAHDYMIDRKSFVLGKRGSVRVDLGGRRSIKQKNKKK